MEEKKLIENKIFHKGFIVITISYVIFLILFGLTINEVSKSNLIQDKLISPIKEYNSLQQRNIENEKLIKELLSIERNKKTVSQSEPSIKQNPQQPSSNQNSQNLNTQYNTKPVLQPEPEEERKCYRVEIEEGEFKSNKCYTWDDHIKLEDYIWELNKNRNLLESAERRYEMTCEADTEQAREFFEDSCEDAKEDKEEAKENIDKYKDKIRDMLSKGWD